MNRNHALNVIFADPEAGCISSDEPDDSLEEDSTVDDEIDCDYLHEDILEAINLENQLIGSKLETPQADSSKSISSSSETPPILAVNEPLTEEPKKKRGRPRKNPPTNSITNPRPASINSKRLSKNTTSSNFFLNLIN